MVGDRLLLLAAFGFAIDAQAGGLGAWTFIGVGVARRGLGLPVRRVVATCVPPWWVIARRRWSARRCFYVFAMPPMIRARFSTPTIGREGMIGEIGTAEVDVDPDGVVRIRDALWRARTNRATPDRGGRPGAGRRRRGRRARGGARERRGRGLPGRGRERGSADRLDARIALLSRR